MAGAGGSGVPTCEDIDGAAFVGHKLYLGDTDWNDTSSSTAWQAYGFDIDGLTTQNGDLTGHCQPNTGASPNSMNDGPSGLDNSWGKLLVPVFKAFDPNFSTSINEDIVAGTAKSFILKLDALTTGSPIVTKLYAAAPLFSQAVLDGSDCWPVTYESLQTPTDIKSALTVFPASSITSDLWESVDTGTVVLELPIAGSSLVMRIEHARLVMQLDLDHQGATLGLLGGVMHTETFVEAFRDMAGALSQDLCEGTTFESIANQLRQSSDIMADGSQDPNMTCDGISIGIGFDATAVRFGAIAAPAISPPDPCAP